MATCPHCRGPLGDRHVCTGRASRALWWVSSITASIALGAAIGVVAFGTLGRLMAIAELEAVGLVVGPLAVFAIVRALRS